MDILIRQATVIDPASPRNGLVSDILIRDGMIAGFEAGPENPGRVIEAEGLCVAPGFTDIFAQLCDPGQEHRETLETGAAAAAAGGYTDVLAVPNTQPVVHSKTAVEYLVRSSGSLPVSIHPMGAVTRNTEGKELAEMYDMHASGAKAFTDGWNPIQSGGLLVKALQYLLPVDAVLVQLPDDRAINPSGLMNEGVASTRLGLPGRPALAEEIMVARDIELLRYTGSKLHFTGISCTGSVERIRRARAEGLKVTCSVSPLHLLYTDADLHDYDTNLKLIPPLRGATDRDALREAVADGTIDCIASHHLPQDTDHKIVEFEAAAPGAIGLQTAFAALCTALPELSAEKLAGLFGINARRIFGLPDASLQTGRPDCLTLFSRNGETIPVQSNNLSRSANSPLFGQKLRGRIHGTIRRGNVFLLPS